MEPNGAAVRVAVRARPLDVGTGAARLRKKGTAVRVAQGKQIVVNGNRGFTFDVAYGENTRQEEIFESEVRDLLYGCLQGYNASVLAYGQTSSGKTYTMGLSREAAVTAKQEILQFGELSSSDLGIVPRVCKEIFEEIENAPAEASYKISVSYFEIYNETVRDLLTNSGPGLNILGGPSGEVIIQNASALEVENVVHVMEALEKGASARTTGFTEMNAKSSRSHAIFTLYIEFFDVVASKMRRSKFHLVDLAGSERNKRTGAVGERFQESIQINQGLLALGNVISILGDEATKGRNRLKIHVPYRQSKLTRLLRDSIGGNSRTVFIACISPAAEDVSETLNTLKYANRARNIENMPILNEIVESDEDQTSENEVFEDSIDPQDHSEEEREELQEDVVRLQIHEAFEQAKRQSSAEDGFAFLELALCGKKTKEWGNVHLECDEEIMRLRSDLSEAKADLDRDEVIFARKMKEAQEVVRKLEDARRERDLLRVKLAEVEQENQQLLRDSPNEIPNDMILLSPDDDPASSARSPNMVELREELTRHKEKSSYLEAELKALREKYRTIAEKSRSLETEKVKLENQLQDLQSYTPRFSSADEVDLKALRSAEAQTVAKVLLQDKQRFGDELRREIASKDEEIGQLQKARAEAEEHAQALAKAVQEAQPSVSQSRIEKLDEGYITSLEQDAIFYQKTIVELKAKARSSVHLQKQLQQLESENSNLKTFLQKREGVVAARVDRASLAEIDPNKIRIRGEAWMG